MSFFNKMKTVFKVGMSVYDQVFYPNQKGTVKRIDNNEPDIDFPIEVEFEGEIESYTLKGSRSYAGALTLSTAPYTLQGFEQKESVPTFEEAVRWLETTEGTNIMNDSVFLTKGNYYTNLNECTEALKKLILLRDYYNEGWQPNWDDSSLKYIVYIKVDNGCNFIIDYRAKYPRVLHFKSKEIAEKFLKEQKKLLEIAKPLL